MTAKLLDAIGNWNPQLFRELKGRLNIGNIAIATMLSVGAQVLLFLALYVQSNVGTLDSQNFWLKLFVSLSIFSTIALLVAGTYMLVSDLDKEERRGTLNFIRLSPQSASTIFAGKILGVPILLYLAEILAVPLHLYSGLKAQIPLHYTLYFYMTIAASCALIYSGAMLFGLTTSWLGGFQPWLAGAAVLFFIPVIITVPLTLANSFDEVRWFGLPVGREIVLCTALTVSICALGTYWMWQGWQRRFPNPSITVLSKRQSYLLTTSSQLIILGFAIQSKISYYPTLIFLSALNLLLFLGLIAALTPERQALYDWARYRQQIVPQSQNSWRRYPILDLIWSEKSPPQIAIGINILISMLILTPWMPVREVFQILCLFPIFLINFILIYATVTQLFLFSKIRNREAWAVCTVGGAILLPPIVLLMLSLPLDKAPLIWLFSVFPMFGCLDTLNRPPATTIFLPLLGQWTVLVLLNLKLMRQLRIASESASKALLKA